MKIFILEDNIYRIRGFVAKLSAQYPDAKLFFAEEIEEAKKLHDENAPFDKYYLDHDLGGKVMVSTLNLNTGSTFAKHLKEKGVDGYSAEIVIHSLNPVGAENIKNLLPGSIRKPYFNF